MAKRKQSGGKSPNRTPSYIVFVRIRPELGEAFEEYLAETEPQTDKKAVIELALREFFAKRGKWPRPVKP